jgi:hypothetical protein
MRPRLPHTLGEPRNRRARRSRRGDKAQATALAPARQSAPVRVSDPDLRRAREAGGPIDHAAYSCECGYRFVAPVSTTVHCPHCGVGQAW